MALAIAVVWSAEALNTAIEWLCDRIESQPNPKIRDIKDVAAGAVLLAAFAAIAVGAIIFAPKIFR